MPLCPQQDKQRNKGKEKEATTEQRNKKEVKLANNKTIYQTFIVNASIRCFGSSGDGCGNVSGVLRYNATSSEPIVKYFPDPGTDKACTMYSESGFQAAMTQAIEALPKNEKLVLSLCHEEDLSLGEVARIFGVSEARVAQIHTIAMLRIRGKLQAA